MALGGTRGSGQPPSLGIVDSGLGPGLSALVDVGAFVELLAG